MTTLLLPALIIAGLIVICAILGILVYTASLGEPPCQ